MHWDREADSGRGSGTGVMQPASTFTQLEGPESELHLPLAPLPNHEALAGVHFEVGGAHGALGHVGTVQPARAARQTVPQHRACRPVLARHPRAHVSLSPLLPRGVVKARGPHHHRGRRGVAGAYQAWVVLCVSVDPPRTSVSVLAPKRTGTQGHVYDTHMYTRTHTVHISGWAGMPIMQCDAVRHRERRTQQHRTAATTAQHYTQATRSTRTGRVSGVVLCSVSGCCVRHYLEAPQFSKD